MTTGLVVSHGIRCKSWQPVYRVEKARTYPPSLAVTWGGRHEGGGEESDMDDAIQLSDNLWLAKTRIIIPYARSVCKNPLAYYWVEQECELELFQFTVDVGDIFSPDGMIWKPSGELVVPWWLK